MFKFIKDYITPFPFFMLCLYVIFMYNAQATLLPTVLHSTVMYSMIAVTFLYALHKCNFKISIFSIWYFIFLFTSIVSYCFSSNCDGKIIYDICVSFIISFCYIQNISSTEKIKSIVTMYVISSLIMTLQIWITGQLDYIFGTSAIDSDRLGGEITGNANIFSALFMYAGVFSAWLFIYSNNKIERLFFLFSLIVILLVMIISGGRKTIIAVLASVALFFFLKTDNHNRTKYIKNAIIAIFAIGIVMYAILHVPFLYEYVGQRFEGLFDLLQGKGAHVDGDAMRSKIITLALDGWTQQPLFGYGIDSFKEYNQSITGRHYYAHNNYAELLYDVGIIGFIIYYWIYIYIFKALKRLPSNLYIYKVLGYGLLLELIVFDFGGVSYYLTGSINLLAIAFICGNLSIQIKRENCIYNK